LYFAKAVEDFVPLFLLHYKANLDLREVVWTFEQSEKKREATRSNMEFSKENRAQDLR